MSHIDELDRSIRQYISGTGGDSDFLRLAVETFAIQYEKLGFYRSYCQTRGISPDSIKSIWDIPPLPTSVFRLQRVATFSPDKEQITFLTSGTTSLDQGKHHFDNLETFREASVTAFRQLTLINANEKFFFLSLVPSCVEAPQHSLARMVDFLAQDFSESPPAYVYQNGKLDLEYAKSKLLQASQEKQPVFLPATSVALFDLLTYLEKEKPRIELPPGSRLFETGGRKGRRYVPSSSELAKTVEKRLGIPRDFFLGEYGMTEATSSSWGTLQNGEMVYGSSHWAPIQIVHPYTLTEVDIGQEGCVRLFDLANRHSISALLTGDWGRRRENGVEILDRIQNRELRGCSLTVPQPATERSQNSVIVPSFSKCPPFEQRWEALSDLTDIWRNPSSNERKKFEDEYLKNFSHAKGALVEGLNRTFEALDSELLLKAYKNHSGSEKMDSASTTAAFISAGNLPVTGVFGFFASVLMGQNSLHRTSSRGGGLLRQLELTLKDIDEDVANSAHIFQSPSHEDEKTRGFLKEVDLIFAQGEEKTLKHLKNLAPSNTTFYSYGPEVSAVFLEIPSSLSDLELDSLIQDIFIWEQQGCLSPQMIFAKNLSDTEKNEFEERLHGIAKSRGRVWERKPQEKDNARIDWIERTLETSLLQNVKLRRSDQLSTLWTQTPLKRYFSTPGMIQIIPIDDINSIGSVLDQLSWRPGSLATNHLGDFSSLKFDRVTGLGELQSPPFGWNHGGIDLLNALSGK